VTVKRMSSAAIQQVLGSGVKPREQKARYPVVRRKRKKPAQIFSSDEEDESASEEK